MQLGIEPAGGGTGQGRVAVGAVAERGEQVGGQVQLAVDDLRGGFDPGGVVEGDAGGGKQEHADEADGRADPVPLVQGAQPEATTLLLLHAGGWSGHWGGL